MKYDISVIIPFYNVEKTLRRCLDSIMVQTHPLEKIQVILIDNNSKDASKAIAARYTAIYENVFVLEELHQGVSYARNTGLDYAQGKYILFLDADDYISEDAISKIVDFFDEKYEEVDMVSYHEIKIMDGVETEPYIRYSTLKETGVYDLEKNPYILQVNVNICIKNVGHKFDTSMHYQEDQQFCCEILKAKMKIGYVKEAIYYYEPNEMGLAEQNSSPIVCFELSTAFFEKLFQTYEKVPGYFQALFFHDILWKLRRNRLWPYHYEAVELEKAKKRILQLLKKVDNTIILSYPGAESFEKLYWLRQKGEIVTPYITTEGTALYYKGRRIFYRKDMELMLKKIRLQEDHVVIRGFVKSPIFSYGCKATLIANVNGDEKKLNVCDCGAGYYRAKEKTNIFLGFELKEALDKETHISFSIELDGITIPIMLYPMPTVVFDKDTEEYYAKGYHVCLTDNVLQFERLKNSQTEKRKIWLYMDAKSVERDNGYYQFLKDMHENDNIERYYVITNQDVLYEEIAEERLIRYGSEKHKSLFFRAEKILTSFMDDAVIWPPLENRKKMRGAFNAEIIYLQHGILHAHLPWYYSKYVCMVDKIVISSEFEKQNLIRCYDYEEEDLILTGMPRLELLKKGSSHTNRILYAPSWRSYLVKQKHGDTIERTANRKVLEASAYYKGIAELIRAAGTNFKIDLKLHPEFYTLYAKDELFCDEPLHLVKNEVDLNQYDMLITDFSSLMYDFVYMNKPIICYLPDVDEIKCGLNHYREFDIPLEDGYGYYTNSPIDAVQKIKELQENHFKPEGKYTKRYEEFFYCK